MSGPGEPLRVCFLWHMHQPWYVDPVTGEAGLPWARLHSLKSYREIPELAAERSDQLHTFNFVPALLDQVERAASGGRDRHLDLFERPSADLGIAERRWLLREFFSASDREIEAVPGYAALRLRVRPYLLEGAPERLSDGDARDLQVFFALVWSGEEIRNHGYVASLLRKGGGFTEVEKRDLGILQRAYLTSVLPTLRGLAGAGRIALTTTPYHHPILPLLAEPERALAEDPGLALPGSMRARPADAAAQVRIGRDAFERHFGFRPDGAWPAEGAIGAESLRLLATDGVRYVCSDEELLFRSLGGAPADPAERLALLARPWRFEGGPAIFFRERELSDRIGFVYARWRAEDAARDFVRRLEVSADALAGTPAVLTIALDGENAWETYAESGRPYLRALFGALAASPRLRVCSFEEALPEVPAAELPAIRTGSWIGANLRTWAGDAEKNRAWELLAETAARVEPVLGDAAGAPVWSPFGERPALVRARSALLAAEASDWFWWFGEGHTSAHDAEFDRIFRAHLLAACTLAGVEAPEALHHPIRREPPPLGTVRAIAPMVDGRETDPEEWRGALPVPRDSSGTMADGSARIGRVLAGTDGRSVFLRLDGAPPPAAERLAGCLLHVRLLEGSGIVWDLPFEAHEPDPHRAVAVAAEIAEVRLPIGDHGFPVRFRAELRDGAGRTLQLLTPDRGIVIGRLAHD